MLKNNLPIKLKILLPINVKNVSSSLPALFKYLEQNTWSYFWDNLAIFFKEIGLKEPSALNIHTFFVAHFFIPSITAAPYPFLFVIIFEILNL